jgi:hypothetical protein
VTRWLATLADRINPIVVKETRQAVSSRLVGAFLLLFLTIECVVMLLFIVNREMGSGSDINLRAGRDVFMFVQGVLLGTCMILIPTMTGVRLASERSDVNVDLLFISSLSPRDVLSGKLFAAAALALVIFSAAAPFMTFAYVLRGLDVPTIFLVLLADYLAVLVSTSFFLLLASIPANRGLRIVLGILGFLAICYMGAGLLAGTSAFLAFGSGFDTTSGDFWLGLFGVTVLILGAVGLFFVWSVALISPPAANRAFIVRVYTLALWIIGFAVCAIWSMKLGEPEPVAVWGVIAAIWFSFQMIVAVCERESWGPRVTRRIPKNVLLRVPAFVLYSGAAGGLLFAAAGAVISVSVMAAWYDVIPTTHPYRAEFRWAPVKFGGLIASYSWCYCMTAALIRRLVAGQVFRIGYTWLLAGILFGLGCTVPFIIRFALFNNRRSYGYDDDLLWLYLPNPIVMIEDSLKRSYSHEGMTIGFLAVWGSVVTLVNLTWLLGQAIRFRPRGDEADE